MNKSNRGGRWLKGPIIIAGCLCLLAACSSYQQSHGFNGYRGREFKQEIMQENIRKRQTPRMNELRRAQGERSGTGLISPHTNTRMEWSRYLDEQIAAMDEVDNAKSVVTDRYVYVSVELKEEAKRMDAGTADGGSGMLNQREEPYREQVGPEIRSGIAGNGHDLDTRSSGFSRTGNLTAHPHGELHSSSSDADLSNMPVAVKQKIVQRVKELSSPSLHHVFVSANDEFRAQLIKLQEMEQQQGQTKDQIVPALNSLATRFFPDTEGTGSYGGSSSGGKIGRPITGSDGMYSPSTGVRQR